MSHDINIPIYPNDLIAIWYRPIGQFWFLYALMICHLLAALLPGRNILVAVSATSFTIFTLLPGQQDLSLTLHHLPFYVAGLYGSDLVMRWQPLAGKSWLILTTPWTAFVAAVALGGPASDNYPQSVASLPACILGIAGTVLLGKILDGSRYRWLAAVGKMSMTIYVLHILAGSGMRIIMLRLDVPKLPWIYLTVGTVVGVTFPMIAHTVLQRLSLLAPLGLAPRPSRQQMPRQ